MNDRTALSGIGSCANAPLRKLKMINAAQGTAILRNRVRRPRSICEQSFIRLTLPTSIPFVAAVAFFNE
jgi:hypothetical protein